MGKDRFSIMPPTAPNKLYEVANKKYVDNLGVKMRREELRDDG